MHEANPKFKNERALQFQRVIANSPSFLVQTLKHFTVCDMAGQLIISNQAGVIPPLADRSSHILDCLSVDGIARLFVLLHT